MTRQGPRERGLGDAGDRYPQIESILHGPPAGALLLGLVEHNVDERRSGTGVHLPENVGGDLDEERLQVTFVPLPEDAGEFGRRRAQALAQQVVRLGDQLHVGVLDAVVDHLHEVTGPVGSDVDATGLTVDLCRDGLEDGSELGVRLVGASRHDARPVERTFLAAGHTGADKMQTVLAQRLLAASGVGVMRVTAVDDDVVRLEQWDELVDHGVRRRPRLDHDDHGTRLLQRGHEVGHRVARYERALVPGLFDQAVRLRRRPVVYGNRVAVPSQVPGQVAAHDREAGHADLRGRCWRALLECHRVSPSHTSIRHGVYRPGHGAGSHAHSGSFHGRDGAGRQSPPKAGWLELPLYPSPADPFDTWKRR